MKLFLAAVMTLVMVTVNGFAQDEWFDEGDVKYRLPGLGWDDASIHLTQGVIEIFDGDDNPVATFTDGTIEHGTVGIRRTTPALGFAILGGVGMLSVWAAEKADEGEVVLRDGQFYTRGTGPGITYAYIGAGVAGIAGIIAATKSNKSFSSVNNGRGSIDLRVDKDDVFRFESTLDAIGLPAALPSQWNP